MEGGGLNRDRWRRANKGFRCQGADRVSKEGSKKRTAEPKNIEYRMSKGGFASLSLFKIDRIHLFDVRCWTFDVRCSLVSFLI